MFLVGLILKLQAAESNHRVNIQQCTDCVYVIEVYIVLLSIKHQSFSYISEGMSNNNNCALHVHVHLLILIPYK